MSYTGTDQAAQARSYRSTAAAATKRAERSAQRSAEFYTRARAVWRQVAWLAARPAYWDLATGYTPAELEASARTWERLGDTFLRSSFAETGRAAFYRELAAGYAGRARAEARRLAEFKAEMNAGWNAPAGYDGPYMVIDLDKSAAEFCVLAWGLEWFQVRRVLDDNSADRSADRLVVVPQTPEGIATQQRPPARLESPRCAVCGRSAHYVGTWQGHPYQAPAQADPFAGIPDASAEYAGTELETSAERELAEPWHGVSGPVVWREVPVTIPLGEGGQAGTVTITRPGSIAEAMASYAAGLADYDIVAAYRATWAELDEYDAQVADMENDGAGLYAAGV